MRDLIVIGGGEHARVVIDAALTRPDLWNVLGYSDVRPVPETERRFGIRWFGEDSSASTTPDVVFVLGVGSMPIDRRAKIVACYPTSSFVAIVHRDATVSPTATIEPGAVVLARAVVNTGACVRAHAIVNTGAIIEHDVDVGSHAHVGPGAVIGGAATVAEGAHVGLGALVRDHRIVGPRATVGMGGVVVSDVPAGATVMGLPARAVGRK